MYKDIDELEKEIEYLERRVSTLEKKDNRRTGMKYLKIIIKLIFYGLIIFSAWKAYDYVVHGIPDMVSEKIQELIPFKIK